MSDRIEQIVAAAAQDESAFSAAVEQFVRELRKPLSAVDAQRLLDGLRARRRFAAIARLADAFLMLGDQNPYVRRQYAQALIESGQLSPAEQLLRQNLSQPNKFELSQSLGLLGRIYKQRFVSLSHDRTLAEKELQAAVGWYSQAYGFDPAWHGANLVALLRRGERERFALENTQDCVTAAERLLHDLEGLTREWSPWDHAGAGEACLALGKFDDAAGHYGFVARSADSFALASASRQLREIWGATADDGTRTGSILAALEARLLSTPGGALAASPKHLAELGAALKSARQEKNADLEAVLGDNATVTLNDILRLLDVARAVVQVVDRNQQARGRLSGGTGFIVDGALLRPEWKNRPLLVTNHHVLNEKAELPAVRPGNADLLLHFSTGKLKPQSVRVDRIIASSPPDACDFSIAGVVDPDGLIPKLFPEVSEDPTALGRRDAAPPRRVYLVGHPQGRGLEFSLSDNDVLDHELEGAEPPPHRRVHYKAPTESGMSGSPVIDTQTLAIVALHHASTAFPLHAPDAEDYSANEAFWMGSVLALARGAYSAS